MKKTNQGLVVINSILAFGECFDLQCVLLRAGKKLVDDFTSHWEAKFGFYRLFFVRQNVLRYRDGT